MFRTMIDNEYRFFETEEEAIEAIKNHFSSETCIFQKVTNWTSITKNHNSSCQVCFIKIENGMAKSFSKSILWIDAFKEEREEATRKAREWKENFSKNWNEIRNFLLTSEALNN